MEFFMIKCVPISSYLKYWTICYAQLQWRLFFHLTFHRCTNYCILLGVIGNLNHVRLNEEIHGRSKESRNYALETQQKNLISGFIHSPDESIYLNLLSEPQKGRRKVVTIPILCCCEFWDEWRVIIAYSSLAKCHWRRGVLLRPHFFTAPFSRAVCGGGGGFFSASPNIREREN